MMFVRTDRTGGDGRVQVCCCGAFPGNVVLLVAWFEEWLAVVAAKEKAKRCRSSPSWSRG